MNGHTTLDRLYRQRTKPPYRDRVDEVVPILAELDCVDTGTDATEEVIARV